MNKSKIIYQIGRLEAEIKKFKFNEKECKSELTSFALKEFLENRAKVILIYPVSLLFNRTLICANSTLPQNFKEKIKSLLENEENREKYFEDPRKFFEEHPHNKKADDFIVIYSIGEYEGAKFEGKYNDIVLEIFFSMIERYLENGFTELYIDISSGLNVYISALLEASRHFYVFSNLQNWNEKNLNLYLVFSEPILGSSCSSFKIFKENVKYKIFFSSPIKKEDIDNYSLARKIVGEDRKLKSQIQNYLENFAIHFSALKNATPLVHYTFERYRKNDVENLIKEIKDLGKRKLKENWKASPSLQKDKFLKTILSLALYIGIIDILEENEIKIPNKDEGVEIKEMKNKFKPIYEKFGLELNEKFVGNEIGILKGKIKNRENEWITLSEILGYKSPSPDPRNFFAHAGLEGLLTEIKKCGDKIYVRYKEEFEGKNVKGMIKDYLKNAL